MTFFFVAVYVGGFFEIAERRKKEGPIRWLKAPLWPMLIGAWAARQLNELPWIEND